MNLKTRRKVENTSEEKIEAIKKRVSYYKDDIIIYKQLPLPTAFDHKLFFEKLKEIVKPENKFYLFIDLREVLGKPNSELREILKNINYYKEQIIHCCVVVDSKVSALIKVAAKIVIRESVNSYSIHSDFDEALEKISSYSNVKNIEHVMNTDHAILPDTSVYLHDNDIIIWEGNPIPEGSKTEKLSREFKRILDLSDHSFYIVFDLRKVKTPPDAETRAILKKTFKDYKHRLLHGCVIVPNTFMKITAKLVMKNYFNSTSYHTKMNGMEGALNEINSIKG